MSSAVYYCDMWRHNFAGGALFQTRITWSKFILLQVTVTLHSQQFFLDFNFLWNITWNWMNHELTWHFSSNKMWSPENVCEPELRSASGLCIFKLKKKLWLNNYNQMSCKQILRRLKQPLIEVSFLSIDNLLHWNSNIDFRKVDLRCEYIVIVKSTFLVKVSICRMSLYF